MIDSETNRDHELDEHLVAVTTCDQERATAPVSRCVGDRENGPIPSPPRHRLSTSGSRALGACAMGMCLLVAASMLGPEDVTAGDLTLAPTPVAPIALRPLANAFADELRRLDAQEPSTQQLIIEPMWNEDLWR